MGSVAVMGCGSPQSAASSKDGWVQECPGDAFCFSRPGTLVAQPGQVIDSLARQYRSNELTLIFDMGQYGTSVDHLSQATQEPTTIDGRSGRMLIADREIVLIVPKVYQSGTFTVQFTMMLKFEGKASRELAQRIFQTIAFKPPR